MTEFEKCDSEKDDAATKIYSRREQRRDSRVCENTRTRGGRRCNGDKVLELSREQGLAEDRRWLQLSTATEGPSVSSFLRLPCKTSIENERTPLL